MDHSNHRPKGSSDLAISGALPIESGKLIRAMRQARSIKPSDIERTSKAMADAKGNPDFYVPHSTLADIEAGSVPSIHKIYSLSVALEVHLAEVLSAFGIDPAGVSIPAPEPISAPVGAPAVLAGEASFRFQLNFEKQIGFDETRLLSMQGRERASAPPLLPGRFDSARYRYALIVSRDDSMADLLPASSLVEIDTAQKTIEVSDWRTLCERPLYLVWHCYGHTCCWCQVEGRELTLIPHPLSRQRVRRFKMPNEATVIGRVTNAWRRFDAPLSALHVSAPF